MSLARPEPGGLLPERAAPKRGAPAHPGGGHPVDDVSDGVFADRAPRALTTRVGRGGRP